MDNVKKLPLRDFTRYCMSIAQVPSSYLSGLTLEEQLLWLCSFLTNEVIPTVNNNGEAVEELQQLYIQLKDYVDNYFDNLDVQEEINNKLDEMAESGELADIIAQYLSIQSVLAYNTVAEMKAAENIAEGCLLQTYGFYANGDGGAAKYKARQLLNTDTIDNMTIFALHDPELVAEIVVETPLNPLKYGAYGDGTHDDQTVLNYLVNELSEDNKEIDLVGRTYGVSVPISIEENISNSIIKNGTIKALEDFTGDYMIEFPGDFEEVTVPDTDIHVLNNVVLDSINLECNEECGGIKLIGYLKFKFDKINIYNYIGKGLYTTRQDAHELIFSNSILNTNSTTAIGIEINNNDNIVDNVVIKGGVTGIKLADNNVHCNQFNNIHIYGITTDTYKKGIVIGTSASNNNFNNIYLDECGIYSNCYWGLQFYNVMFLECKNGIVVFDTSERIGNVIFDNCYVYFTSNVTENTYIYTLLNNSRENVSRRNVSNFTIQASGTIYDNSNVLALTKRNYYNYFNISDNATKYEFNGQGYIFQNPQTNYNITVRNNECIVNSFNSSGWHWYGFELHLEKNTEYLITDLLKTNTGNIKILGTNNSPDVEGATTTILTCDGQEFMRFNTGSYDHILIACYNSNMAPDIIKVN